MYQPANELPVHCGNFEATALSFFDMITDGHDHRVSQEMDWQLKNTQTFN